MTNFKSFNLDISEASDVAEVVEVMIEHAVERRTSELEDRVEELEEENLNLKYELKEASNV